MNKMFSLKSKAAWYVYTLADPLTGGVFYIGKGSRGRVNQHEIDAINPKIATNKKLEKIKQIWANGAQVVKSFVAYFWDEQAAYDHETDMIAGVGLCNLTNVMPGGQKAFDRRARERKARRDGPTFYLHINEFHQECRGFPLEFQAMYLNLLATMWQNDGQISDDEDYLMRASGSTKAQWNKHRQDLANLFTMGHGSWNHNRIREEIAKAYKISDTKRAAINKRWDRTRSLAKVATDDLMAKISKDGGAY